MEELIEILINLIANWMRGNAQSRSQRTIAPPLPGNPQKRATKAVRSDPSNRAVVTRNMPTAARKVVARRPKPPAVAMARPIVTSTAPAPAAVPPPPPMKAVNAKQIAPASKSTKVPLTAAPIAKWLNPTTLQQQFILTEIFQPPLALRESKQW
jgi:hypothetical protein